MSNQSDVGDGLGVALINRRTNRRDFLVAGGSSLAAVSLLGLAACGGDSGGSGDGEVLISMLSGSDAPDVVKEQLKVYNKKHPQGKGATRVGSNDTTKEFEKLRTQFQAGSSDIDVIMGDIIWPPQFAAAGWIADVSERFTEAKRKEFIPGVIAGNTYDGKLYGVPWYTDAGLLFYRSDLLEDAGYAEPPKTWDELKEMAAKIQKDAGVKNGFVFTGAEYEGGTVLGIEFIRTAGGDVLDGNNVIIDSPEAIEGLQTQQSLVAEGIAPEAVANFREDEAGGAFLRGDAVFMRMWPYQYDFIGDKEKSKITKEQVGLTQVPVRAPDVTPANVGGGFNFLVNVDADQETAWNVIEYLTAAPQQKMLAIEAGFPPTRPELYEDPEVLEALPAIRLAKDAILNTTTPPVSPYYSDMSLAMAKQFHANILGDVTPEEAAGTLKEELGSIISRGG